MQLGNRLLLCCYYNRNVLVSCSFAKMFVFVRVWGFVCVLVFVCIYVRIRVCVLFWGTIFIPVLNLRLHKYFFSLQPVSTQQYRVYRRWCAPWPFQPDLLVSLLFCWLRKPFDFVLEMRNINMCCWVPLDTWMQTNCVLLLRGRSLVWQKWRICKFTW